MTDGAADRVYIEPITTDVVKIIERERPDGLLASSEARPASIWQSGLQTTDTRPPWNRTVGTSLMSIKKAEDRELFKETMGQINERFLSTIVTNLDDAAAFAERPVSDHNKAAYTLGGTGGGIAENMEDFKYTAAKASSSA